MGNNYLIYILCIGLLASTHSVASSNGWNGERLDGWNQLKNIRDLDRMRNIDWLSSKADSGEPWAQFYLGVFYSRKETPEELRRALPLLREAANALSNDPLVIHYRGWVELLNGNYNQAIDVFGSISFSNSQQELAGKMNYAHALLLNGDAYQAKKIYAELFEKKAISPNKVTTMGVTDLKIFKYLGLCNRECDQQIAWFNQSYDNTRTKWVNEW